MRAFLLSIFMVFGFSQLAFAQADEIIVTGARINSVNLVSPIGVISTGTPGIYIEKKGDYLLLQVTIENDSRDLATRLSEIEETINNMMEAAKDHPDIQLSLVEKGNLVRALSVASFNSNIRRGSRPDTSLAHLKVKTNIPEDIEDAFKLTTKLAKFIEGVEEVGRTTISTSGNVSVSIIDPYQHRSELIKAIMDDINKMTDALNGEYRVILTGMDSGLQWSRSGDFNLAFYMNYAYTIIPASLNNYTTKYIEE